MNKHKYVALDVDSANIVAGVYDSQGKCQMLTHLRNEAKVIQEFFRMLSGTVHVTFEEGAQAAYLYELIRPVSCGSGGLQFPAEQTAQGGQQVGPD